MPTTRVLCSNPAKTRKPLKFAGVPQTRQQISAVSGPTFSALWGHVEEILLFNKFFSDCRYVPQLRRYSPTIVRWCADGEFLAIFCILHFQRAACSTFQISILNSHQGHTRCENMVDIQSATAEIRRVKEEEERKKKKPQDKNIMACPVPQGGHNNQLLYRPI